MRHATADDWRSWEVGWPYGSRWIELPPPHACFAYGKVRGLAEPFVPLWCLLHAVGVEEERVLAGTPDMDALFGIVNRVRDVLWWLHPSRCVGRGDAAVLERQ